MWIILVANEAKIIPREAKSPPTIITGLQPKRFTNIHTRAHTHTHTHTHTHILRQFDNSVLDVASPLQPCLHSSRFLRRLLSAQSPPAVHIKEYLFKLISQRLCLKSV